MRILLIPRVHPRFNGLNLIREAMVFDSDNPTDIAELDSALPHLESMMEPGGIDGVPLILAIERYEQAESYGPFVYVGVKVSPDVRAHKEFPDDLLGVVLTEALDAREAQVDEAFKRDANEAGY